MTTMTDLGNWRSGAWGANKTAHLWRVAFASASLTPACGARLRLDRTERVRRSDSVLCRECLIAGIREGLDA